MTNNYLDTLIPPTHDTFLYIESIATAIADATNTDYFEVLASLCEDSLQF